MNKEFTVVLRSNDAIVQDGKYNFSATGLYNKLASINCLQMALATLTIPSDNVFKWCPRLSFSYILTKASNQVWNVNIPPFRYLNPDEICRETRRHIPDDHAINVSFSYDPQHRRFQLTYSKINAFSMNKAMEQFFQFNLAQMVEAYDRVAAVIESIGHAPYYDPVEVFIECDIAECSIVGSKMRPLLGHFWYDMDDITGMIGYSPRPLTWINCAYRPQGDVITVTIRADNGTAISIDTTKTAEIILELKFRNSYLH